MQQQYRLGDWGAPSPVAEWAARDVVAHLVEWSTGFLAGGGVTVASLTSDDPAEVWQNHSAEIQGLLDDQGTAAGGFDHPMVGTHRLDAAIDRFYTSDVFMHTWDLARSADLDHGLDPHFSERLLVGMRSIEDALRSSEHYGPAVPVSETADPVSRLVGFIGRDPEWQPPA